MTTDKNFKRLVREHMSKTGKSYAAALKDFEPSRELSYRAFELDSGGARRMLADEKRRYRVLDIQVREKKNATDGSPFLTKTLPLFGGFGISVPVFPRASVMDGFGLTIESQPEGDSWTWFEWDSEDVFRYIHDGARVRVTIANHADFEELVSVTFVDDVTLQRMEKTEMASPPTHEFVVLKGSVLQVRADPADEERYTFPKRRTLPPVQSCSFCGRSQAVVDKLLGGHGVMICNHCVDDVSSLAGAERGTAVPADVGGEHASSFRPAKLGPLVRNPDLSPRARAHDEACQFFCREAPSAARHLFVGDIASICARCLETCRIILAEAARAQAGRADASKG